MIYLLKTLNIQYPYWKILSCSVFLCACVMAGTVGGLSIPLIMGVPLLPAAIISVICAMLSFWVGTILTLYFFKKDILTVTEHRPQCVAGNRTP